MATAKRIGRMPPLNDPRNVELILTPKEARALAMILGRIGGSPAGSRGYTNSIAEALYSVGFDWNTADPIDPSAHIIRFTDK